MGVSTPTPWRALKKRRSRGAATARPPARTAPRITIDTGRSTTRCIDDEYRARGEPSLSRARGDEDARRDASSRRRSRARRLGARLNRFPGIFPLMRFYSIDYFDKHLMKRSTPSASAPASFRGPASGEGTRAGLLDDREIEEIERAWPN